jgi:cell division protein FtsQ
VSERKRELEKIPWVESAAVMRLWPNRLRVLVKERTPVAFVAIGGRIGLIDAQGVVMEMSPSQHANSGRAGDPPPGVRDNYAFSVIRGMAESDPLSTRAPRMRTFARLVRELDGDQGGTGPRTEGESGSVDGGASGGVSSSPGKVQYSRNLEEVDLSDPDDVKVTVKGPSGPILLHLGNENFLPRFMIYLSNVQKWEHDRGKLESVDLRYGRQVILNPDMSAEPPAMAPLNAAPAAVATKKVPRIAARHPQAAWAKPGAAMVSNKVANKAVKRKVPTNRMAKARAAKIDSAHSKPQRAATAKPRHGRGKKRT